MQLKYVGVCCQGIGRCTIIHGTRAKKAWAKGVYMGQPVYVTCICGPKRGICSQQYRWFLWQWYRDPRSRCRIAIHDTRSENCNFTNSSIQYGSRQIQMLALQDTLEDTLLVLYAIL